MQSKSSLFRVTLAFGLLLCGAFVWSESTTPKKKLSLKDLLSATAGKSRRSETVAGVRGLNETGNAADSGARNEAAVEWLEKISISEEDLQQFIVEGQLK